MRIECTRTGDCNQNRPYGTTISATRGRKFQDQPSKKAAKGTTRRAMTLDEANLAIDMVAVSCQILTGDVPLAFSGSRLPRQHADMVSVNAPEIQAETRSQE